MVISLTIMKLLLPTLISALSKLRKKEVIVVEKMIVIQIIDRDKL